MAGPTNVSSGNGNDIFRVGSLAPTVTGGKPQRHRRAPPALDGGANTNQLILDDTGDTLANTGAMSANTRVTGLGMAGGDPFKGINYTNFATFLLSLGSGSDNFTRGQLDHRHDDHQSRRLGNDTFTLGKSAGTVTINGGIGNDTFNIRGQRRHRDDQRRRR